MGKIKRKIACILIAVLLLAAGPWYALRTYAAVTVNDGTQTVLSVDTAAAGEIVLPDAPDGDPAFAGWSADGVLLPAGATYAYAAGAQVSFTPVYLHLTPVEGAQVRFTEGTTGMRFLTEVSISEWEALAGKATELSLGTLIVPLSYATAMHGLSHALLAASGRASLDVETGGWYQTEGDTARFAGSIANIFTSHYAMDFTAVGYVRITYTNGATGYVYAGWQRANARRVSSLAISAYRDTAESADGRYAYPVDGGYSPYTAEQRAILTAFADPVVALISTQSTVSGFTFAAQNGLTRSYSATVVTDKNAQFRTYFNGAGFTDGEISGFHVISAAGVALNADTVYDVTVDGAGIDHKFYDGKLLVPYYDYTLSY